MAITINRQQREAIYQEVVLDLNGLTDLWTEFDDGNFDRARELRDRFVLDMRLLDDLGWEPEVDGEAFELTMDGVDLAAVVSRLIEQTGAIIHTQIVEPIERTPHAERSVRAQGCLARSSPNSRRAGRLTSSRATCASPATVDRFGLVGRAALWRPPTPTCRRGSPCRS